MITNILRLGCNCLQLANQIRLLLGLSPILIMVEVQLLLSFVTLSIES